METASSPPGVPEAFSFEQESGGIESYRLDANGLQVLLLPRRDGAPVATFMVTYHVGSRNEHTGHTGATHILEHLMFKGTERFNKEAGTSVFRKLEGFGARLNASTWVDRTNYYEMLPSEHLDTAIDVEADRMRNARLAEHDVEAERKVILNEFDQAQNEPVSKLFDEVWSTAFVAHPYHHPTIGWRSDIETVTPDGLRHFYDTYYWPNNATVSVIGNFDRGDVLASIEEHFGAIDRSPHDIPEVSIREPEQTGPRHVTVRQDGQLGAVMLSYKTPPATNPDSDVLDVVARILASGKGSRLYRRCTDQGLTNDVFGLNFRLRDPGLFSVFAYLAPNKEHEDVEAVLLEEVERLAADGVTDEEVNRARTQLKAQMAFDRDGPMKIASQLNEAIACGDWTLYTEAIDRIEEVTASDVQRVAKEYLTDDRLTTGWYVPTGTAQPAAPPAPSGDGAL